MVIFGESQESGRDMVEEGQSEVASPSTKTIGHVFAGSPYSPDVYILSWCVV